MASNFWAGRSGKQRGSNEAHANNRWWEFYTIRYLLGTAIGTITLLFLVHHHPDTSTSELVCMLQTLFPLQSISGYQATILGLSGLAYCYIASSPILFIHALRSENFTQKHLHWSVVIFLILLLATFFFSGINNQMEWLSRVLFGPAFFILLFLVCIATLFVSRVVFKPKESTQLSYYASLTKARGYANKADSQYIESYQHLREHGNALLIVQLEIVLGTLLYYSPQDSWIALICLWIMPGACIYFFAQSMEKDFVEKRFTCVRRNDVAR